jgi:hypothetical protein
MSSSKGHLFAISTTLMRFARYGDVAGMRAYVRGDAFLRAFNGLDPERRRSAMRSFAQAEALCEAKARHPLVKPKRIDAKRVHKTDWSDPVMRAKLANAYARAGGDDEQAARTLGVSLGAARLAKKRHLDTTTGPRKKAS